MERSPLQHARALPHPARDATLRRSAQVAQFWKGNADLLASAWKDWQEQNPDLPTLDDSLLDPRLRDAVASAWADPTTEQAVGDLWQLVSPGVYQCQFFDPEQLARLRDYLTQAAAAEIPVRPPYGIVLNRSGMMLDRRSSGYLAAPAFHDLYTRIVDHYFRPISRLLFPEVAGYDTQSFGFSIEYQPTTDTSIRPHTDASAATLNINLNLPGESFGGSVVDFYEPKSRKTTKLTFEPGMAVIHRGQVAHAAHPITSGERSNLVLWLYGDGGRMPPRGATPAPAQPADRWTLSTAPQDGFAPF